MGKVDDLKGKKFNNLYVVERADSDKSGKARWKCLCDCGNYTVVTGSNLKTNSVKSCGCLIHRKSWNHYIEKSSKRLYSIWCGMKGRCNNPNHPAYKNYGGRGISICKEWKDFRNFEKWSLDNEYFDNASIERKDVNENYSPQNCCWIPLAEQAKNRRSSYEIIHNGRKLNLTEYCKELNLDYKRVHSRIYKLGWDFEKAVSTEPMISKRNKKARK